MAGVNALGRGQDRESLIQFINHCTDNGTEAISKFIDPSEYIKRLATSQGIDVLNLVKTQQQVMGDMQQQQEQMAQQELVKQAGQFAGAPMMDPTKNPQAQEMINGITGQANPEEEVPPEADPG